MYPVLSMIHAGVGNDGVAIGASQKRDIGSHYMAKMEPIL